MAEAMPRNDPERHGRYCRLQKMNADKDKLYKEQLRIIGRGVRSHYDEVRKGRLNPEMQELLQRLADRQREIEREIEAARKKKR